MEIHNRLDDLPIQAKTISRRLKSLHPSENMTFPEGMQLPDYSNRQSQGQISSALSGDFQLHNTKSAYSIFI